MNKNAISSPATLRLYRLFLNRSTRSLNMAITVFWKGVGAHSARQYSLTQTIEFVGARGDRQLQKGASDTFQMAHSICVVHRTDTRRISRTLLAAFDGRWGAFRRFHVGNVARSIGKPTVVVLWKTTPYSACSLSSSSADEPAFVRWMRRKSSTKKVPPLFHRPNLHHIDSPLSKCLFLHSHYWRASCIFAHGIC